MGVGDQHMKKFALGIGVLSILAGCDGIDVHISQHENLSKSADGKVRSDKSITIDEPNVDQSGSWSSDGTKGSGHVISETRNVGDFHAVDAGGALHVELTVGPAASFKIEGEDNIIKQIKSVVNRGVLRIYTEGNINPQKEVRVTLTAPSIDGLNISGASEMQAKGVKADKLDLDCSGASKLFMTGSAVGIDLQVSGASETSFEGLNNTAISGQVSGAAKLVAVGSLGVVDLDASGASRVDLSKARAKRVKLDLNGASNAQVIASDRIDAELSGASNLKYGGTNDVHIDGAEHGSSAERID